jgi:hypothetical protein
VCVCSSGFLWRRAFLWRNQICCFKLALKDQWCKSLFIKSSSAFTSIARAELSTFTTTTRAWNHSLVGGMAVLAHRFVAKTVSMQSESARFFISNPALFSSAAARTARRVCEMVLRAPTSLRFQIKRNWLGPWHNFPISLFGLLDANFTVTHFFKLFSTRWDKLNSLKWKQRINYINVFAWNWDVACIYLRHLKICWHHR